MTSTIAYRSSTAPVVASPPVLTSDDPLTDALGLLRPRSVVHAGLAGGGRWAVRFDPFPHVRLGVVVRGHCWLVLEGGEPILLQEGDFYLLGNPPTYRLASSLDAPAQPAETLWDDAVDGVVRLGADGGEEDTLLCGGLFAFDDTNAAMVVDVLPDLVLVRADDPRGHQLAQLSELLIAELKAAAVGGSLVLDHLARIVFVQMLRAYADQSDRPTGWLAALHDDGIGAALRALHADVGHHWTLTELARISTMSRSAFAAAFKRRVGTAPLDYLIQWRMSLARDALRRRTCSISELAAATGYASESAFSTAFRRVVGCSPKQYRDRHSTIN